MGNFLPDRYRTCPTTGLPVCLTAQRFVKLHAVFAVVFLLLGGIGGILLALTRWSEVHLLGPVWYYRILTFHGLNMLIFWIITMEIAILYFTSTSLLNNRMFSGTLAWITFILMIGGAFLTDYVTIIEGKGDVLMTSYAPLKAKDPKWYLGIILFAVGALLGVIHFFLNIYIARRDKTYGKTMPLVSFGALAAAIIALFTLLHGAAILVPTWMWAMGWIQNIDAGVYRLVWWAMGHSSQQINVCAMVAVWYFLATLTTGARPINETVCRTAFVLYILFISLASAHHLLVDPGVGASWKIWNTSYALYLAVLASMIHGFTVPASVEVIQRKRNKGRGLFGWLARAPWGDPGFSAMFLSLCIFGFIGGITGVTLGTQQINIIAHNTLRIPGHFHATVAGGTTLAFMGLAYYVIPLIFQRDIPLRPLARIQPYIFAVGITLLSIGMSFAGSYGVPRRHWDVTFSGAPLGAGFDSTAHLMLAVLGIGG
ncbi:MAG: cytochrome C oxidase subunit I, partial [Planctomycetota bacterium]